MAERFYCQDAARHADGPGSISLVGDEARHLSRVRRVKVGDIVEVFDGLGFATRAEVLGMARDRVSLRAVGSPLSDHAPSVRLTLAVSVPKGERFDWLVEKATEIGVTQLVPLVTERSVVDPRESKLERLRRTVIEASKQCGRNRLMEIRRPTTWAELIAGAGPDALRLVAHPGGKRFGAWPRPGGMASTLIAVGPEGGFTDGEIEAAAGAGWVRVGLGASILRIETAGLTASARLLALSEADTQEEGPTNDG